MITLSIETKDISIEKYIYDIYSRWTFSTLISK